MYLGIGLGMFSGGLFIKQYKFQNIILLSQILVTLGIIMKISYLSLVGLLIGRMC